MSGGIAIVDFGAGNTRSVLRAFQAVGAPARLVRDPNGLQGAERVVLPGVGAAGAAMVAIREQGLVEPLRAWALAGRPFLGICLGAQLLLDRLDEDDAAGLELVAGTCRRFPSAAAGGPLRIPHIGWNRVDLRGGKGFEAYFVHGFWLDPDDPATVFGTTDVDGFRFPSLLRSGSLTGTQFHPEKSGAPGRALLAAWAGGLLDSVAGSRPAGALARAGAEAGTWS